MHDCRVGWTQVCPARRRLTANDPAHGPHFIRHFRPSITRDLRQLVQSAVGKLMDRWHHQDARIDTYKLADLDTRTARDLIVRATDVGGCPNQLIPRVLREWREPRHEALEPRVVWSLFNALTEAVKGQPHRAAIDTHVGLDAPISELSRASDVRRW